MFYKCSKCYYCLEKLGELFINCVECSSIKLCAKCFSCGAEGGRHKKTHKYTIQHTSSNDSFSIFNDSNWQSLDDLKLLDALEAYGFGNWNEISFQLQAHKAIECKDHYEKYYINGLIGNTFCDNNSYPTINDHSIINQNNAYELNTYKCDLRLEDQRLLGYLPNRGEFEYEYMNNAEDILCSIPYNQTICDLDKEFQLALIGMYNQYINDRHFRHRLARTHNLMNYFLHDLDAQSSKSNSTNPIRLKRYIKRGRGRGCSNRRIKRRNDSRTNLVDSKNSCPSFNLSEPILICNSCTPPMDNNIHMDTNNVNGQLDLPMNVHSKFPRPTNEITKSLHCSSECLTTLKPSPNSDDLPNLNHLSKHRTVFGLNSEQPWINPESLSTLSNTLLDHSDSGICLTESSNFSSSLSSASSNSTMSITKLNNSNMKHIRPRCNSDSICNKKIMSSLYSLKSTSLSSLFTYNQMGQLGDNLNTTNVAQSAPHDYLPQSSFDEDNSKIEKSVKRRGRNRGCLHKIDFHSKRSYGKWNCFGSVLKHPNWLKPFIRFMAPSEAETFMKSIEREYVLRNELKHLLKSQGIELLDPHESLFKSEEPSEPIPLKSPLFSDEISNANESCPGGVKTRNSTNPQIVNSKLPKSKPTDSNGLYLKRKCTLIHSGSVPNEKTKCHASSKTPKPVCS